MLVRYSFLLIILNLVISCSSDKKIVYHGGQKFYVEDLQSLPMRVTIFSDFLNNENGLKNHLDSILQTHHNITSSSFQNDKLLNFLNSKWKPADFIFETRTESDVKFLIEFYLQIDLSTLEPIETQNDDFVYNADIITTIRMGSVDFGKLIPINNNISEEYYYRSSGQIVSETEIKKENYIFN